MGDLEGELVDWYLEGVGEKGRRQKAGRPEIQGEHFSACVFFEIARVYVGNAKQQLIIKSNPSLGVGSYEDLP